MSLHAGSVLFTPTMSRADRDVIHEAEPCGRLLAAMMTWRPDSDESPWLVVRCTRDCCAGGLNDVIDCLTDRPDGSVDRLEALGAYC